MHEGYRACLRTCVSKYSKSGYRNAYTCPLDPYLCMYVYVDRMRLGGCVLTRRSVLLLLQVPVMRGSLFLEILLRETFASGVPFHSGFSTLWLGILAMTRFRSSKPASHLNSLHILGVQQLGLPQRPNDDIEHQSSTCRHPPK